MRWNIIVECVGEDRNRSTITLATIERLAGSTTAQNLGVNQSTCTGRSMPERGSRFSRIAPTKSSNSWAKPRNQSSSHPASWLRFIAPSCR